MTVDQAVYYSNINATEVKRATLKKVRAGIEPGTFLLLGP